MLERRLQVLQRDGRSKRPQLLVNDPRMKERFGFDGHAIRKA